MLILQQFLTRVYQILVPACFRSEETALMLSDRIRRSHVASRKAKELGRHELSHHLKMLALFYQEQQHKRMYQQGAIASVERLCSFLDRELNDAEQIIAELEETFINQ